MLKEWKKDKKTVFVALSGGVDSSVAALLLKKQGYYVVGVFMRCWRDDIATSAGKSCMEKDAEDARKVAEQLEIPFYVWDFEKEYKKRVVDYMVDGYRKGITPNPDVMCNKEIKFGLFLEKALKMGADYVATGHYVKLGLRIKNLEYRERNKKLPSLNPKFYILYSARDLNKDQSYFLWTLTQDQLKYCLFPIGDYLKSEVRKIAKKANLLTAEKKDSQGICFLGKVTLDEFLGKYIPEKKGDILLASTGKKIGEHKGAHFYTIGQRHGLGISGGPYYITEKDVKKNIIKVAEAKNEALYKKEIALTDVNFVNANMSALIRANRRIDVLVRVRYRQPLISATLKIENSKLSARGGSAKGGKIEFDAPVKFVASGQSAVLYNKKGEMLGGGVIK
ncbi:MAG: tRNA 2-thiouridine(34) synthase MnmA [Patescibacteria group bacterium]